MNTTITNNNRATLQVLDDLLAENDRLALENQTIRKQIRSGQAVALARERSDLISTDWSTGYQTPILVPNRNASTTISPSTVTSTFNPISYNYNSIPQQSSSYVTRATQWTPFRSEYGYEYNNDNDDDRLSNEDDQSYLQEKEMHLQHVKKIVDEKSKIAQQEAEKAREIEESAKEARKANKETTKAVQRANKEYIKSTKTIAKFEEEAAVAASRAARASENEAIARMKEAQEMKYLASQRIAIAQANQKQFPVNYYPISSSSSSSSSHPHPHPNLHGRFNPTFIPINNNNNNNYYYQDPIYETNTF
jgi:hypothetical protein